MAIRRNAVPDNRPAFASTPWVWIVGAIGIVLVLGVFAVLIHAGRKNRRRTPFRLDPRARQALERDIQEAWVRGADRRPRNGRWSRAPAARSRWGWLTRPEEGLNELGEAPPPYEGRQPGRGKQTQDGVEMETLRGSGAPPAKTQLDPRQDGTAEAGASPPAYSPRSSLDQGGESSIARPHPAAAPTARNADRWA